MYHCMTPFESAEFALIDVSRDMANLVSGIIKVFVKPIPEREEFVIEAQMEDGTTFSSRVLSDGTLRLLTLVALKNDPHHRGVFCLEEPENRVHPFRLKQIAELLRTMTTDFSDGSQDALRQVLVSTHSPALLPHVPKEEILYVDTRERAHMRRTSMLPEVPALIEDSQVQRFLESAPTMMTTAEN